MRQRLQIARALAVEAADGRAVRRARCADAKAHAWISFGYLEKNGKDHRVRDARHRRGGDARRSHLRDVGRAGLAHHRGGRRRPAAAARPDGPAGGGALQAGRRIADMVGMPAPLLFGASILIAFAAWQFLSSFVFNPFLIPPPLVVLQTAIPMVKSGEIFRHVAISMARVGVGFFTGCAAAIVLGVVLGRVKLVNELLDPVIELLRYLS